MFVYPRHQISGSLRLVEKGQDLKQVTEVIADLRRRHKKARAPLFNAAGRQQKQAQSWQVTLGKPESLYHPRYLVMSKRVSYDVSIEQIYVDLPNGGHGLWTQWHPARWCLCWVMPLHNSDMTI